MNELDKLKIGFAIALLAGLFTLGPLVNESNFSFLLFTIDIKLTYIYWFFVAILSLSVYFYALTLVKIEKANNIFQSLGNWTYAIALLYPPFVITIYLISLLSNIIAPILKSSSVTFIIGIILGTMSSIIASILVNKIQVKFKKEGDKESAERIKSKEINSLEKSKILYQSEFYDLVIVELWNTVELSFKRVFLQKAIPFSPKSSIQIIDTIRKNKLLPTTLIDELEQLRIHRNKAAHPTDDLLISKQLADKALKTTEKILIAIDSYKEKCYYCNKEYPLNELEVEETNGDYFVCNNCLKEHPDWKDEIISLGMDP
jgi:hypothetical protein